MDWTAIITAAMVPVCGIICSLITDRKQRNFKNNTDEKITADMIHILLKKAVLDELDSASNKHFRTIKGTAFMETGVDLLHKRGENGEMTAALEAYLAFPLDNQ